MAGQSRYKKILVPLDGSKQAERAIPHALDVARANGDSEVILYSVFAPPAREFPAQIALAGQDTQTQAAREQMKLYLNEMYEQFCNEECNISTHLDEIGSSVPNTICDYVQRENINLVVMSTRGRTGLSRLLFGSTARDVMECLDVPVLLIQPDKDEKSGG